MVRPSSSQVKSPATQPRGSKKAAGPVRSILALAAGASALPLTDSADAAIIVDSSQNNTVVGWDTPTQTRDVQFTLPGGGGLRFRTLATASGAPYRSAGAPASAPSVFGVQVGFTGVTGNMQSKTSRPYLAPFGATVAAGTGFFATAFLNGAFVYTNRSQSVGNSAFSGQSKYLLFDFMNGTTKNYGWLEIKALTTGTGGEGTSNYSATLGTLAYDDSGATILAGQTVPVPEPSSAALAMGGALVAGAAGLRRWRKDRATVKGE
jgi:hypothetical protein